MSSFLGFSVALSAALAWGGFDAARKKLVSVVDPVSAAAWINLAQGVLFVGWAAATHSFQAERAYLPIGVSVLLLQVAANVLLFRALAIAPLSSVVPMLALTPVFASIAGWLLLEETLHWVQWAGVLVVVAAAFGMHGRNLRTEPGVLMAMGVALIWSVTTSLDKLALEHTTLPVHAAVQSGGVGVVLVAALKARGSLQAPRAAGPFVAALTLGTAALALQLWAIQLVFVGFVETLKRAIGLVMAVVLGRALFAEPVTRRLVIGVAVLVAGTAMLVLGEPR